MDDDGSRPAKKLGHEVGQVLDDLSVFELEDRIALLRAEIERVEAAKQRKRQSLDAAGSIFGKPT